jgi:hypothetical protein
MAKRWSPEEKAILTKIWRSPVLLKTQMDLLPGRTCDTATQHATKVLNLGPKRPPASEVFRLANALMRDKRVRSAGEIAALIGRSHQQVRRVIQDAIERGEYRVVKWRASSTGGELEAFYRIGRGKSRPKPAPMNAAERGRKYRKRLGAKAYKVKRAKYTLVQKLTSTPPRDELMDAFYGRREYAQEAV